MFKAKRKFSKATGLDPEMLPPQHIGYEENNRNSTCPPASAGDDGDGLVELGEGLPFYELVLLPLEPFPTASDGTIDFKETYIVDSSITPLQSRVIVLHNMSRRGIYDNITCDLRAD